MIRHSFGGLYRSNIRIDQYGLYSLLAQGFEGL